MRTTSLPSRSGRTTPGRIVGLVVLSLLTVYSTNGLTQAPSTLRLSVFLVDSDLNVKPVPRHAITLRRDGSSSDVVRVVTGLDGKAEVVVPPGIYALESERPAEFQGKSYRWKKSITVKAAEVLTVELSIDDAVTEKLGSSTPMADLPALFREWQKSVVTVWSETGHGSGFVIDPRGLIATNQHVVGLADYAAVQFSETLKVPAQIVSRSPQRDVAILRVNPQAFEEVSPVRLGYFRDNSSQAVEGQQVFTIGSPLNQRKVMTAGIVSKIEPHAIISDININHGNSGGPLFTTGGVVIGITTFGDFSAQGGPGISGIVKIDEAADAIAEAQGALSAPPPAYRKLPVEPDLAFPVGGLEASLRDKPIRPNDYSLPASDFDVTLITPVLTKGVQYAQEQAALKEKSKRASKTDGGPSGTRIDPFADFKNWAEYVGEYRAVLIIDARPKLIEGFWSAFSRGMAESRGLYGGPAQMHFKADFARMTLRCGDQPVEPIHPGKVEHYVSQSSASVKVNDVTFEGFYTYSAGTITPECGTVTLELYTEKEPTKADTRTLSPKLVQRIWEDFAPFRALKK